MTPKKTRYIPSPEAQAKKAARDTRIIELARLGASDDEIFDVLQIRQRRFGKSMRKEISRHRAERTLMLRAKLYEMAMEGSPNAVMKLINESTADRPAPPHNRHTNAGAGVNTRPEKILLRDIPGTRLDGLPDENEPRC